MFQKNKFNSSLFANYQEPLLVDDYTEWLVEANRQLPKDTSICLSYDVKMVDANNIFNERETFYFAFEKEYTLNGLKIDKPFASPHTSPIFSFGVGNCHGI